MHSFALRFWISHDRVVGWSLPYVYLDKGNIGYKEIGISPQLCGRGRKPTSLLRIFCKNSIIKFHFFSIELFIEHNFYINYFSLIKKRACARFYSSRST